MKRFLAVIILILFSSACSSVVSTSEQPPSTSYLLGYDQGKDDGKLYGAKNADCNDSVKLVMLEFNRYGYVTLSDGFHYRPFNSSEWMDGCKQGLRDYG